MTASNSIYKYDPLLSEQRYGARFRLMNLQPGQPDSQIICGIQEHDLENCPAYEALSYSWGDPKDTREISINSCSCGATDNVEVPPNFEECLPCSHCIGDVVLQPGMTQAAPLRATLRVTRNLEIALQHLRYPLRRRTMWIDAICIDQSNIAERSEQVKIMVMIYQNAKLALLWLGPPDPDTELAFQTLGEIAHSIKHHIWQQAGSLLSVEAEALKTDDVLKVLPSIVNAVDDSSWSACRLERIAKILINVNSWRSTASVRSSSHSTLPTTAYSTQEIRRFLSGETLTRFQALHRIFYREYWRRLWIVQEIASCKEGTLVSGPYTERLEWLELAYLTFDNTEFWNSCSCTYPYTTALHITRVICYIRIAAASRWCIPSFPVLLSCTSMSRCSDPRDRIYALVNLATENWKESVVPADYNMPMLKVFTQLVRGLIHETGSLSIICWELHGNKPDPDAFWLVSGAATWLPMFSPRLYFHKAQMHRETDIFRADSNVVTDFNTFHSPRLLRLSGYYFDEINHVKGRVKYMKHGKSLLDWLPDSQEEYPAGETRFEAFWRTLVMDQYNSGVSGNGQRLSQTHIQEVNNILQAIKIPEMAGGEDARRAQGFFRGRSLGAVGSPITDQTFFTTRRGYMGEGPNDLESKDVVFVIRGSPIPLILKPRGKELNGVKSPHGLNLFSLVGPAYIHGIMDGEFWNTAKTKRRVEKHIWLA